MKRFSCWSLAPPQPRDLGAILVARGFNWNWLPRWMWLDLDRMETDHAVPRGLKVFIAGDDAIHDVSDLPYYDAQEARGWHLTNHADPQEIWHFLGTLRGEPVAHTMLCVTRGPLGIAGIYAVGVRPTFRNQGIAKAVIGAACQFARDLGCRHATLNGTGERVYRQLGFEIIGYGQTWVSRPTQQPRLPNKHQIAFYEAMGRGDLKSMEALLQQLGPSVLTKPLASGMTPLKLAVEMDKRDVTRWLVDRLAD